MKPLSWRRNAPDHIIWYFMGLLGSKYCSTGLQFLEYIFLLIWLVQLMQCLEYSEGWRDWDELGDLSYHAHQVVQITFAFWLTMAVTFLGSGLIPSLVRDADMTSLQASSNEPGTWVVKTDAVMCLWCYTTLHCRFWLKVRLRVDLDSDSPVLLLAMAATNFSTSLELSQST